MSSKTTTAPPSSLFTAILFQSSLQNSNSNDDVEVEPNCLSKLQEPLLTESSTETAVTKESSNSASLQDATWLLRLKVLNFSTGSLSALLSQYILSQTMWNETVMSSPFGPIVIFSLMWSFLTCVIVFSSMFLNVWILEYRHNKSNESNNNKTTTTKTSVKEWDRFIFQMEAHHVVGALLAVSLYWIFIDVLHLAVHARAMHTGLFVAMTIVCYGIFFKVMVSSNPSESVMMPTYQLLATTLGLVVGLCSQFVLSFCLWRNHMTSPVFSNVILFSLVWSVFTVIITFAGCLALRSLALDDSDDDEDATATATVNKEAAIEKERIHLRMESHYVFAALIGICGAWISMDLVLDMPQQILPSLGMLVVALAAFSVIIYCFPEEQCLEEYASIMDMEHEQQKQAYTKVAVVDTV
jgi:hypothetical protein